MHFGKREGSPDQGAQNEQHARHPRDSRSGEERKRRPRDQNRCRDPEYAGSLVQADPQPLGKAGDQDDVARMREPPELLVLAAPQALHGQATVANEPCHIDVRSEVALQIRKNQTRHILDDEQFSGRVLPDSESQGQKRGAEPDQGVVEISSEFPSAPPSQSRTHETSGVEDPISQRETSKSEKGEGPDSHRGHQPRRRGDGKH